MKHSDQPTHPEGNQTLRARREGIYEESLGDKTILFDATTRLSVTLDPTAAFVWSRCDGKTTTGEIVAACQQKSSGSGAEAEVFAAINLLAGKGFLLDENSLPPAPIAPSRRAILNYGALAAKMAILFPALASILGSSGAEAATVRPPRSVKPRSPGRRKRRSGRNRGNGQRGPNRGNQQGNGPTTNNPPEVVDCYGGWGEWSECDWFMQAREYTVIVPAANGGLACEVEDGTIETQDCGEPPVPVDCAGTWSPWGPCSVTCGGGTQSRTFTVTTPAANGGAACPASPETQQTGCANVACNTDPAICAGCSEPYQVCVNGVCVNLCNPATYDPTCCYDTGNGWFDDC